MHGKHFSFLMILSFIMVVTGFFSDGAYAEIYTILLRNGGTIHAVHYKVEGDDVRLMLVNPPGSMMMIPNSEILKIKKIDKNEFPGKKATSAKDPCIDVMCSSEKIACCRSLEDSITRMSSYCEMARNPRHYYSGPEYPEHFANNCRRFKTVVSDKNDECPGCEQVKSCCSDW